MDITHELLALLERFAARAPLPKVRGLLLPPAAVPTSIAGEFCAIELDDGSLGLSYCCWTNRAGAWSPTAAIPPWGWRAPTRSPWRAGSGRRRARAAR